MTILVFDHEPEGFRKVRLGEGMNERVSLDKVLIVGPGVKKIIVMSMSYRSYHTMSFQDNQG